MRILNGSEPDETQKENREHVIEKLPHGKKIYRQLNGNKKYHLKKIFGNQAKQAPAKTCIMMSRSISHEPGDTTFRKIPESLCSSRKSRQPYRKYLTNIPQSARLFPVSENPEIQIRKPHSPGHVPRPLPAERARTCIISGNNYLTDRAA